jgi:hypothetical protein
MRKLWLVLLIGFAASANAETSTKVLALKLWKAIEKEQNISYTTLDNYRVHLASGDSTKAKLDDPAEFKRYQTVIRNVFVDKVSNEFTRAEITNLTKIYLRPEMAKLRTFSMDFWDDKSLKEILDNNSK